MKVAVPGRIKQMLVGNVIETQGNVPVRIGVSDLKTLSFYTALPNFNKWSLNYPLHIEDVKLRDKKWVEFLPRLPDRDAVADQFYVSTGKNSKVKKFRVGGQAEINLDLDYQTYQKVIEYRERMEDEGQSQTMAVTSLRHPDTRSSGLTGNVDAQATIPPASTSLASSLAAEVQQPPTAPRLLPVSVVQNVKTKVRVAATRASAQPGHASSKEIGNLDTPVHTMRKRKSDVEMHDKLEDAESDSDLPGFPDSKRLRGALIGIKAPAQKVIRKFMANHRTIDVTIYKPQIASLDTLLRENVSALLIDPTSSVYSAVTTSLTFLSEVEPHYGVFKLAFPAQSTSPVFRNVHPLGSREPGGEALCLKQTFYLGSQSGKRKPHDAATQVSNLMVDICCLVWADHLMKLVYDFIDHRGSSSQLLHENRPHIPRLHFTSCGLAVSKDRDTIFLVEELIDRTLDGRYVKYINNSSAKPLLTFLPDESEGNYVDIAHFLCFAQHVQYFTTKMAYVSDLQGGLKTLSDPQIITNPKLGKGIFGEGNVGFNTFEEEHECNSFCDYYGLRPFVQGKSKADNLFQTVAPPSNETLPSMRLLQERKEIVVIDIDGDGDEDDREESEDLEEGEISQLSKRQ